MQDTLLVHSLPPTFQWDLWLMSNMHLYIAALTDHGKHPLELWQHSTHM